MKHVSSKAGICNEDKMEEMFELRITEISGTGQGIF
jgi:hypothetical protein